MLIINKFKRRAPFYLLPLEAAYAFIRYLRRVITLYLCKLYGIKIGRNVFIGKSMRFVYPWNIKISDQCVLGNFVRMWSENSAAKLLLKEKVEIGRDCILDFTGGLTLENGVLVSEGVIIYTHDHGYDPHSLPVGKPLTIGNNSWIGARAIILPSVQRIGNNVVIGAGTVVSKDVPDDHIFVGAQGRLTKKNEKTLV